MSSVALFIGLGVVVFTATAANYTAFPTGGTINWTATNGFWGCALTGSGDACASYPGQLTFTNGTVDNAIVNTSSAPTVISVNSAIANPVNLNVSANNITVDIATGGSLGLTGGSSFASGAGVLSISGGTLTNAGTLTVSAGSFNLNNGTLSGGGVTNVNAPMSITATAGMAINQQTINNSAIANFISGGTLTMGSNGAFNNLAAGTFNGSAGSTIAPGAGTAQFVNGGLVQNAVGGSFTVGIPFRNAGTVSIPASAASDVFSGGSGGTGHGGAIWDLGTLSSMNFGGLHLFNSTELFRGIGTFTINGGSSWVVNVPLTLPAGENLVNNGAITFLGTPESISVGSAFSQTASGSFSPRLGPPNGTSDVIIVTGAGNLGGVLNPSLGGGYTPANGDTFTVVSCNPCSGTFNYTPIPYANGTFRAVYTGTAVQLVATPLTADVSIGPISALPNTPTASQPVTWTVPVNNGGPDTPANTTVQLSLSGGSISSATAAGGGFACTNTATTATCTSASFAPGGTTISVIATPPAAAGPWTMTGNIGVSAPATDPNPANNTSTTAITVTPSADVKILKSGPANLVAGSTVTYTLVVANAGPSDATNVMVSDNAPGLNFFSTDIPGCGLFPCSVGPYPAGTSRTYSVTFNVPLTASGNITNTATANDAESDPNPGNNTSTLTLAVVQHADLMVTKKGPTAATPGSNVTFTITVTNNGPSNATNVMLDDPTPTRLTFVSATAPCAAGFASPCALAASLSPGQTKSVNVTYTVQPGGSTTTTNQATVSSATNDPTPGNNVGTATLAIGICPATPTNQQPTDGTANQQTGGVLIWSDANAASYNVFLGPAGMGCMTQVANVKTPAYLYSGLQGGTTYEWRVEAVTPGCTVRSSSCIKFTTTGSACPMTAPTLMSPLSSTVNGPATFTWSSVPGAKDYQLFVNGTFVTMTTATTYGPITVANGPVVWYVVVDFDNCPSLTSSNGSFNSCDSSAKTIPSIVAQSDAGQPYTLFWDPVAGATKYEVDQATDVNFTAPTTLTATGTSLAFQHSVTTPTAFFYRVRAFFACANGFGSNSVSVRIVLSPVTAPANPNVSAPSGSDTLIPIVVHVAGFPDGSFPFTATLDPQQPWLVRVDPSTGILPPEGINLTVFANPSGLPTGTHTGTVIVLVTTPSRGGLAANGVTPVGAPVSISLVTPVTPKPSGPPPANSLIIPSTGHLDGINSRWASDVRILNTSSQTVHYQVTFTPDNQSQGVKQTVIETAAGSTTALDDVVKTWYGVGSLGESSNGSLEIRPLDNPAKTGSDDAPSVSFTTVASSRTYNAAPNSAAGTLAEYIPATLFQNFVGKAVDSTHAATILSLQQVAQNDSMRTNFGVMEASGLPASVLVSVFDSLGNKLLDLPLALQGGQHSQLNGFLSQNKISLSDGRIQVQVVNGDGKITAYASVIDNKSGDPMLVTGVPLNQTSSNAFVLPGVADLNTGAAAWRTDMRIFNPTSSPLNAQLTLYPLNGQGQPQSTSLGINPGEVKQINNAMQSLFGITNAGGALHVQTATAQPLVVSGRTYNLTSNGTYGQLISASTAADAIGKGDAAFQILQAEDSVRQRTNVGIYEVTGKPATVQVTLFLPDSKFAPSTQIPLPANGYVQVPVVQSFGLSNVYNARVSVSVVDGDGRVGAYGSVIDQITQAPTLIPAQH